MSRRASFESGKINVGPADDPAVPSVEEKKGEGDQYWAGDEGVASQTIALREQDAQTNNMILECIGEGCSVEALMALDEKLAQDEQKISDAKARVAARQKTSLSQDNGEGSLKTLAWYDNFLNRMATTRGQLQAVKNVKDTDFVSQILKAISVSFGGSRPGDYPKVGVSPYSE